MCLCAALPNTHTHTSSSGGLVKNIASLLLGNPLHTGVGVLTLNVCLLCVSCSPSYPVDCLTELLIPKPLSPRLVPWPTEKERSRTRGEKIEANGKGLILWIHYCLCCIPHATSHPSRPSSSSQIRININTYPSNPFPSTPLLPKKGKKNITTLGYQLIKPSQRPLPAQKPRKDNKRKVLRPNKRAEINTVPRDFPLSLCHPPQ